MSQIYTVEEVANHFKLHPSYVKKMAREGLWPHWRPTPSSRLLRFTEENIREIESSIQLPSFTLSTGRKPKN